MTDDFRLRKPLCKIRSPLTYTGGKSRHVDVIAARFPDDMKEMVSPFMGGGGVELAMAASGVDVHAGDVWLHLVEFWNALRRDARGVAEEARRLHPMSNDEFYALRRRLKEGDEMPRTHMAAAFYALNKCSFSGSINGGYSKGHERFNMIAINYLARFRMPERLRVRQCDFERLLDDLPDAFAYCDPPYLVEKNYYGFGGEHHRDFDHERLARVLRKRKGDWVLSYNDCPEVRRLYKGFRVEAIDLKYCLDAPRIGREVLVSSS